MWTLARGEEGRSNWKNYAFSSNRRAKYQGEERLWGASLLFSVPCKVAYTWCYCRQRDLWLQREAYQGETSLNQTDCQTEALAFQECYAARKSETHSSSYVLLGPRSQTTLLNSSSSQSRSRLLIDFECFNEAPWERATPTRLQLLRKLSVLGKSGVNWGRP